MGTLDFLNTEKIQEQALINKALSLPLDLKVKKAIAVLQQYEHKALELSPDGYYLADSFGKDSSVCLRLLKMSGVKFKAYYNNTTIDPPELLQFGKKYHPETKWNHHGKHLILQRMVEKGTPPTRMLRWCCEEYKDHGGDGLVKIVGVRIAESSRRAGIWKIINVSKKLGFVITPIVYWTDKNIWAFHKKYKVPYCKLYDEGFSRLGCIGCPLAGPKGQKKEFKRWPKYETMWKRGFELMWERWYGVPTRKGESRFFEKFGSAEEFYKWWIAGKSYERKAPCVFEEMMKNR